MPRLALPREWRDHGAGCSLLLSIEVNATPGVVSATAHEIADGVLSTMWFSPFKKIA